MLHSVINFNTHPGLLSPLFLLKLLVATKTTDRWWSACWSLCNIPWQCSRCPCEPEIQCHAHVYPLFLWRKSCVLPLLLFPQSSSISFHRVQGCSTCACPFHVFIPGASLQLLVSLYCMCQWWCCLFRGRSMMHMKHAGHLCPGVWQKVRCLLTQAATSLLWYSYWFSSHGESRAKYNLI